MSDLRSIRYSNQGPEGTGLQPWDPIPRESLISGDPVQSGHVYHSDDTGQLTSGVWHCTPMVAKPGPYDVNEFMLVLDGAITLVYGNGNEETFSAGECFVIPKGTPLSWKQTGDVLKYWVIFEDNSGEELEAAERVARRIDPGTASSRSVSRTRHATSAVCRSRESGFCSRMPPARWCAGSGRPARCTRNRRRFRETNSCTSWKER